MFVKLLKWQSLSLDYGLLMLILLNHYMFIEGMIISGLRVNKMYFKTHYFVYNQR